MGCVVHLSRVRVERSSSNSFPSEAVTPRSLASDLILQDMDHISMNKK